MQRLRVAIGTISPNKTPEKALLQYGHQAIAKERKLMVAVAAKWTLEDYHRMIESGVLDHRRVELIKGEIVEMAPEGEPHAYFVS
ncbi:MAG: hypothetical protein ABG776_19975, partial [Cyanobacteria bacterium J06555_13]